MDMLISEYGEEFCTNKTISELHDHTAPGHPLRSKCEIYYFTLKKKDSYQRELLDEMLRAMETEGRKDPNFYSVNRMSGRDKSTRRTGLLIGENTDEYIELGKDYDNYINVNILDTADVSKTHRYAYVVEWREAQKGMIDLRYIVTYAKIPQTTSSISVLDLGKARVNPFDNITVKGPFRFQWQGKDYPIEKMDSIFRSEGQNSKQEYERIDSIYRKGKKEADRMRKAFVNGNSIVLWSDTLDHDTDPVTDVIQRLQLGKSLTADDLLCNDNILLLFSQLKKQFNEGDNMELNAISIYSLCKRARETGYFTHDAEAKEFLKGEVQDMLDGLVRMNGFKTEQGYLKLAIKELEKIETE